MPDPTENRATTTNGRRCNAKSTDGKPCTLEAGHPSVMLPGVAPSEYGPDGGRLPSVRHLTADNKTFATR